MAVPAPAQFTYTAGDTEGDTGTVTLTSTSNRGIGSTSVLFKVPKKETPAPPPTAGSVTGARRRRGYVRSTTGVRPDSSKTDYGAGSYISNAHEATTIITDTFELGGDPITGPSGPAGEVQVPSRDGTP